MSQQHHSNIHLTLSQLTTFLLQCYTIFLIDIDIFIIRYHAQDWHTTNIFEHLASLVEKTHIATKLIDNDAFDELSVLGALQHDATIDGSKHAPSVDIAHQNDICLCMSRHRHIHQIAIFQIDFCDTASTLHHNGIIAFGQTIESIADLLAEVDFRCTTTPVIVGIFVADGLAIQNDLGSMVALGLQQQGVHVRMTRNARSLSLNSLSASYLESFWCSIRVQCHILSLERCRLITILTEYPTESCCNDTLTDIAACTCEHNRMQLLHI